MTEQKNPCTCVHEPGRHYETIGGCNVGPCGCTASQAAIDAWVKARCETPPVAPPADAITPPRIPRSYQRLAELARAATPAPWERQGSLVASRDRSAIERQHEEDRRFAESLSRSTPEQEPAAVHHYYDGAALVCESMRTNDAAFVAAANPLQVLDLLGELAEAQEDARGVAATATATAFEASFLAEEEADAALIRHDAECKRCGVEVANDRCEEGEALAEASRTASEAHFAACEASRAAYRARHVATR